MRIFCRWVLNFLCWNRTSIKTSNLNFDSVPNACNARSNGNTAANEGAINVSIYSPSYLNAENDLSSSDDNVSLMGIIFKYIKLHLRDVRFNTSSLGGK